MFVFHRLLNLTTELCTLLALLLFVQSFQVLDEDVASPAEIAKAYMGSRPPKATPLNMAASQKLVDSFASGDLLNSSTLSLVPRPSGNVDVIDNGFVTPRPRGRSALYSMARLPYSRVRATSSIKVYSLMRCICFIDQLCGSIFFVLIFDSLARSSEYCSHYRCLQGSAIIIIISISMGARETCGV